METTKKIESIIKKLENDKAIQKNIASINYVSNESFIEHAFDYIKAIKQNRMICNIASVSNSGMSRTIKFLSCEKSNDKNRPFYYRNYWTLFKILGYKESRANRDCFTVSGCGMDMIFETNYSIIHKLHRLGFISKKQCEILAQQTPSVI